MGFFKNIGNFFTSVFKGGVPADIQEHATHNEEVISETQTLAEEIKMIEEVKLQEPVIEKVETVAEIKSTSRRKPEPKAQSLEKTSNKPANKPKKGTPKKNSNG